MGKRRVCLILAIVLCLMQSISAFAYEKGKAEENLAKHIRKTNSHSAAEAVQWAKSKVGQSIDVDKKYGAQCVDFIMAYYQYLGVSRVGGNGSDYTHNALPSGWTRIKGAVPQPGDILVYIGGPQGYGHVGIFESTYSSYHQMSRQGYSYKFVQHKTCAYNGFESYTPYWGVIRPDFRSNDKVAPAINDYRILRMDATSFTLEATVSDNEGVRAGEFMVWSARNWQDDMKGHIGTISGNKITCTIYIADHYYDTGEYYADLYLYDVAGNVTSRRLQNILVGDKVKPVISDYKVTNISKTGFTVEATVSDNVGLYTGEFMVWSLKNGQGDMKGHIGTIHGNKITCTINIADHYNDTGEYYADLYLYDVAGNVTSQRLQNILVGDQTKPTISNYRVTKISDTSFTVEATVSDNVGLYIGEFMVWSAKNGQDDMNGNIGTIKGNKITCTINIKDHKNDTGKYYADLYLYDVAGNVISQRLESIYVGDKTGPVIRNYRVTKTTKTSFTLEATVSDNVGVAAGEFMVWSAKNGQDDMNGNIGVIKGNKITATIYIKDHKNNAGKYYADLYLYDIAGNVTSQRLESIYVGKRVSKIVLSGSSKKVAAGQKIQLTAKIAPVDALNKAVTWKSSNTKVATVNSKGLVTLKKGSGGKKVTITATAKDGSGKKAVYQITVMKGIVKKITISGKRTVKAGGSVSLKARITSSKGANRTLRWYSSNTKYAKVTSSGKVKTYKAGKGKKVKITAVATDGSGKRATITIKIK